MDVSTVHCERTRTMIVKVGRARFDRRIDPVRLRSVLLNIVNIISYFIIIALSASPRSFAAEQSSVIPASLRPMSAKVKVKSHKWSCRGRAPSVSQSTINFVLRWIVRSVPADANPYRYHQSYIAVFGVPRIFENGFFSSYIRDGSLGRGRHGGGWPVQYSRWGAPPRYVVCDGDQRKK